jgi:transposase
MGELQRQTAAGQSECMHSELSYKRLERGGFAWPQTKSGTITLTNAQLSMLLEGIDWRMPAWTARPEVAA